MNNPCRSRIAFLPDSTAGQTRRTIYPVFKRFFDIVFSLTGIILLALPMLIISIIIRLESPGAAIFRQNRVGQHGKVFSICKFRTMYCSAPNNTPTGELKNAESYITTFGSFLRKSSLDELPQLFNILCGDMSFVGPRPLIAAEDEIHFMREAAGVYSVKPGMTGWAQVNGRDCVSLCKKVELDREYASNISFFFDLKVLLRTILVVVRGDGYAEGSQSSSTDTFDSPTDNAA